VKLGLVDAVTVPVTGTEVSWVGSNSEYQSGESMRAAGGIRLSATAFIARNRFGMP